MGKLVTLKIDGKEVQAPEGINILDAAELAGIHIPNLCYLKGMRGVGACRLCLVEVEGMKAPLIACNTRARDGMVVNTKTEKVEEVRKFVIDLILSMHPLDCMTCTKAGVCRLQQYAYDFEIKESSFTRKKFGYPTDEANPFIKRDPDYCILCGACVRVCKEQGTSVLDFMGRGVGAKVTTANDKPLQESGCTFCGSCVDVCPVNALLEADRWRKGREWEYEKVKSQCLSCGDGCDIIVSTRDGEVVKINAGAPEGSAERYICAMGRFGFDSLKSEMRITSPMKRVSNELKEITWDEAISIVSEKLKGAGKSSGFISTAGILNEDALSLKKFASDVVETKNIGTTVSLYAPPKADADSMRGNGADLEGADLVVLVGLNPDQWTRVLPALDAIIRKKVNRGAKLIVINSGEPKIASVATIDLKGDEALTLSMLAKALEESVVSSQESRVRSQKSEDTTHENSELSDAAELFAKARKIVILTVPHLFQASSNLTIIAGKFSLPLPRVVAVPLEANAKGVTLMGLVGDGMLYREMSEGKGDVRVLYAIGEVPLPKSGIRPDVDFLIVQNSHLTDLAKEADIVLPSATVFESEGTIVDYLGRLKKVQRVIEPLGDAKTHREIFIELAKVLGSKLKEPTMTEIKKAIKPKKVKPSLAPFKKQEGFDVDPQELIESLNTSILNGPRLLWLRETERAMPV
ncbi:MAG: molybdopterin-dependent oxidoreductase [Thermodesulfovibrionales bacterium]|nr:molybdopterin-dependent oxidoreductase [Thermodesulfovibrionales bacterium]